MRENLRESVKENRRSARIPLRFPCTLPISSFFSRTRNGPLQAHTSFRAGNTGEDPTNCRETAILGEYWTIVLQNGNRLCIFTQKWTLAAKFRPTDARFTRDLFRIQPVSTVGRRFERVSFPFHQYLSSLCILTFFLQKFSRKNSQHSEERAAFYTNCDENPPLASLVKPAQYCETVC